MYYWIAVLLDPHSQLAFILVQGDDYAEALSDLPSGCHDDLRHLIGPLDEAPGSIEFYHGYYAKYEW